MGRRTLHMLGLAGMCLCAVVMTIALSLLVSIFFSNNLFQVQFFLTGNSPKSLPLLIFLTFFFLLKLGTFHTLCCPAVINLCAL